MTERDLQTAVIECARLLGWRVAHFRPAQTGRGWRTAVEADGAGFPDLVCVRDGWLLFAELKGAKGRVSTEQHRWLNALAAVGDRTERVIAAVWTPDHWQRGWVERVLRDPHVASVRAA